MQYKIPLDWIQKLEPLGEIADSLLFQEIEEEIAQLYIHYSGEQYLYWENLKNIADPEHHRRNWLRSCLRYLMVAEACLTPGSVLLDNKKTKSKSCPEMLENTLRVTKPSL